MKNIMFKLCNLFIVVLLVALILAIAQGLLWVYISIMQYNEALGFGLLAATFLIIFISFAIKQDKFKSSSKNQSSRKSLIKEQIYNFINGRR